MCKLQIWIKPLPDLGYFAETRVFAAVLLVVAGKLDQVYILGVQWRTACKTVNTDENMLVSLLVGEGTPAVTLNIQVMLLLDHTTSSIGALSSQTLERFVSSSNTYITSSLFWLLQSCTNYTWRMISTTAEIKSGIIEIEQRVKMAYLHSECSAAHLASVLVATVSLTSIGTSGTCV